MIQYIAAAFGIAISSVLCYHAVVTSSSKEVVLIKGNVPFLGVAISYFKDPVGLIKDAMRKHGSVFRLYVAGNQLTHVMDPVLGLKQMYSRHRVFRDSLDEIKIKCFGFTDVVMNDHDLQQELMRTITIKLTSRKSMEDIILQMRTVFENTILENSNIGVGESTNSEVNLEEFVRLSLYKASALSVFGSEFPLEEITKDYFEFQDNFFPLLVMPGIFAKTHIQRRDRLLEILGRYLTDEQKMESSSSLLLGLVDAFKKRDSVYNSKDVPGFFLGMLFGSKSNSIPTAFWTLAHIVNDPEIKKEIQEVVSDSYDSDTDEFDWNKLYDNELINSCFKETVRMVSNVSPARIATADTTLDIFNRDDASTKKISIKKGEVIMTSATTIHYDEEIYPNPQEWMGRRFLSSNDGILMNHSKDWRVLNAFGGGALMCPGRHLAIIETVITIAYMFRHFDIQPVSSFPSRDSSVGTNLPVSPYRVLLTKKI
ncbi:cytochrome P450 [Dipodascopsis uninucleata]